MTRLTLALLLTLALFLTCVVPVAATCMHDVTLIAYTDTTFTYRITSGQPGLSHVDLYLCASQVADVSWPYTEIKSNYIKLDDLNMEQCDTETVTVTMRTAFTPRATHYAWKAGQQYGAGVTEGPLCNSTAIKLWYFRAFR